MALHIHTNRNLPTEEQIEKHKNFDALMAAYNANPSQPEVTNSSPKPSTGGFSPKTWLFSSAAAVLVVVGVWGIFYNSSEDEKSASETIQTTENQLAENKNISDSTAKQTEEIVVEAPVKEIPKAVEKPALPPNLPPLPQAPQKPKGKLVGLKVDVSQYPELAVYKDIAWEYTGTEDATNPWKNNIFSRSWSGVKVKSSKIGSYELELNREAGTEEETFRIPVKPVFVGKAYEDAQAQYLQLKKNYDSIAAIREKMLKK